MTHRLLTAATRPAPHARPGAPATQRPGLMRMACAQQGAAPGNRSRCRSWWKWCMGVSTPGAYLRSAQLLCGRVG